MARPLLAALLAVAILTPAHVLAQQGGFGPWVLPPMPSGFPPMPSGFPPLPPVPGFPGAPGAPLPPVLPVSTGVPVVLELFTSMDCGACESAEYTINRVAAEPTAGARVIPLAYHVEFYGGTSGTVPYVLAAATQRQQTYDSARGRVYTPQAIVDGDREFVGSQESSARTAIASAAQQRKISVDASRSARFVGPMSLALSVRYGSSGGRRATITAVLAESGLVELHHGGQTAYDRTPLVPVVRSVTEVGSASPSGGSVEATLAIPPGAVRANLTAVVMLQDASTHHVLGVATVPAGAF